MRKVLKIVGTVFGVLVIAVLVRVIYLVVDYDILRSTEREFAGHCVTLIGAEGNEDITIDHVNAIGYVSATDRLGLTSGEQDGIYQLDLTNAPDANTELQQLPISGLDILHPHGIDLWRLDDGTVRLFVVNHTNTGSSVEIFDVKENVLVHRRTVRDPLIFAPNDVAAVGPNSFYVTNDQPSVEQTPEDIWDELWGFFRGVDPSTVVFLNDEEARIVADDLIRANGIDASADANEIYVNESLGQATRLYTRAANNDLVLKETISFRGAPDNLAVAPDGSIYVASQADIREIITGFMRKDVSRVPSEVTKIIPAAEGARVEDIYTDDGTEISFLTSAVPFDGNKFVLGAAFGNKIVVCEEE